MMAPYRITGREQALVVRRPAISGKGGESERRSRRKGD